MDSLYFVAVRNGHLDNPRLPGLFYPRSEIINNPIISNAGNVAAFFKIFMHTKTIKNFRGILYFRKNHVTLDEIVFFFKNFFCVNGVNKFHINPIHDIR